jgi:hypothetical protein
MFTLASIIFILGNAFTFAQLNSPSLVLSNLLIAAFVLLSSFAVGIVLLCKSFSRWLFVLLAFCRFWLCLSPEISQLDDRKALQQQVMKEIKNRQNTLARFWFLALLFMLLPMLVFIIAVGLKAASMTAIFGAQTLKLPGPVDCALLPIIVLLGVGLTTVSLVAMPIAAMSEGSARQTIKQTLTLSWKKLPQAVLLCIVIFVLNTIIASPQIFTSYAGLETILMPSTNLALALSEQIWQGLVSIILFPLSLVPFCELLKSSITDLVDET